MTEVPAPPQAPPQPCLLGAALISVLVLLSYLAAMVVAYLEKDQTMLNTLLVVAATNATTVVGYWVGSSAGSARKDSQIAANAAKTGG